MADHEYWLGPDGATIACRGNPITSLYFGSTSMVALPFCLGRLSPQQVLSSSRYTFNSNCSESCSCAVKISLAIFRPYSRRRCPAFTSFFAGP